MSGSRTCAFTAKARRELIRLKPVVNQYMRKKVPGFIRDVRFRNVVLTGRPGDYRVQVEGADAEHDVRDVTFDVVRSSGAADLGLTVGPSRQVHRGRDLRRRAISTAPEHP